MLNVDVAKLSFIFPWYWFNEIYDNCCSSVTPTWLDFAWTELTWPDLAWHDMTWHGMIWPCPHVGCCYTANRFDWFDWLPTSAASHTASPSLKNNHSNQVRQILLGHNLIDGMWDATRCCYPAGTRRNNNVFTTSTRRRRRRVDVVKTLSLRHYCFMSSLGYNHFFQFPLDRMDPPVGIL